MEHYIEHTIRIGYAVRFANTAKCFSRNYVTIPNKICGAGRTFNAIFPLS